MEQQPSMGRAVHYTNDEGHHCPAIITRVNEDGTVNLVVFNEFYPHTSWPKSVPQAQPDKAGGWMWPPRVV